MMTRPPRRLVQALAAVAALGIAGGLLLLATGLFSVTASSGHWPITDWALHSALRHAVNMQSLRVEVPRLDDPALVARGAGHYEIGCASCHGRPGEPPPPIPGHMTPPPPDLVPRIDEWQPRELFYIVKNGIKFTGMPAWVAQERDDEVWSVVAFLLTLPALDARAYRELAYGELAAAGPSAVQPPAEAVAICVRCHGADGAGRGEGAFPQLDGLAQEYLQASLESYAAGRRRSGIMQPVAAALDAQTLRMAAAYYASQPNVPMQAPDAAAALVERGRRLAIEGDAARDIASCAYCHGPERVARNPLFPAIAGQPRDYLVRQLELWVAGGRGGTRFAHVMSEAVGELTPADIEALAAYYAELEP